MVERDPEFEALLDYLRDSRGFDFTGYKRTTLVRRVSKRMHRVGVTGFENYLDYLQVHPAEFAQLFDEILINVTSFFRDSEAWAALASKVLPEITKRATVDRPLRCWCAGVASGQEAYTLAILLAEQMGMVDFTHRVKIYATDVDENALDQARPGGLSDRELESVPAELRDRYFDRSASGWVVRSDVRRAIIFGRHDLVQDAPISRLDLLVCRNTLMYFTAETQSKILARFDYALNDSGFLFLGKAEMMLTRGPLFTPVDLRNRIFAKAASASGGGPAAAPAEANGGDPPADDPPYARLLDHVADSLPVAQVVVDVDGVVVVINDRARKWFRLNRRDVGRPLQDLELSYRPVELRSMLEKAYADRREVVMPNVERALPDGQIQYLDIHVTPIVDDGRPIGASVTYDDVSSYNRLQGELEHSRQELETAYEELQSTNEELETTNEELQSTVEELETTNEELQSSNEELETMNELESTNTELQTINSELHIRTDEVEEGSRFFESVLTSLQLAVIVVDSDLRVKLWRGRSEDMWGMRSSEVQDQSLATLDIGLPVREIRRLVKAGLASPDAPQVAEIDATNRRGRAIRCRVVANALHGAKGQPTGVILLIEELGR